ncbi:hypothetical protein HBI81_153350 [Parastagonospora nodorum]|nr:hypothetical protein HBH53_072240 [Parastagonospora nodorum]KAH3959858.1 hypothetical protein HBH51_195660 [Parastagonospora nodorum]KAH3974104.1 hypothetical protein HBH52_139540 [Parastagonospora nodorum]KAH4121622.1 hypothetical protein HBH47_095510 [Parastagonospora nodorum]KAH4204812.1 hypothetical protein HBI95_149540 [Parastagonospora nodorum]
MQASVTYNPMSSGGHVPVSQLSSPLFRLPAELRVAIFECLDFPPISNEQCHGLILCCRQAKLECEQVAIRSFTSWITTFVRSVVTQCEFEVRVFLPPAPPVGYNYGFRTFKELVLVLPSASCQLAMSLTSFYINLRHLNPVFGLWLNTLTIHFQGFLGDNYSRNGPSQVYRRLRFIIEGGLTYAHDPIGQAREKRLRKYSDMWKLWKPIPSFIQKLVISWDMTPDGLCSDERVRLTGDEQKIHSPQCMGRSMHEVLSENGMLGEYMMASFARFKPSARERRESRFDGERGAACSSCTRNFNYQRDARGLPGDADPGWVK